MLGRGIVMNPGLLAELKSEMENDSAAKNAVENGFSAWDKNNPLRKKEHFREFHNCLYEEYCKLYLQTSGPKVVLFKMKEIWCYLASSFEGRNKTVKKIKKAQNLKEYEAAAALMFSDSE